jgi:hypothetical protein
LFKSAAEWKDSVVVRHRDTVVTAAGRSFRLPLRTVFHYQRSERTLVLDNARSRRLLAQARSDAGIGRAELAAAQRENARLAALTNPKWYQVVWFWVALLLAVLLVVSIGLRFYTFTPMSFFR